MDDHMDDLIEFLNARLDEEADAHQRVRQPYRLYVDDDGRVSEPKKIHDTWGEHQGPRDGDYVLWADGEDYMPNHIASWDLIYDPARVLCEVDAKRALLQHAATAFELAEREPTNLAVTALAAAYGRMVRYFALPHDKHEDYREEWRP